MHSLSSGEQAKKNPSGICTFAVNRSLKWDRLLHVTPTGKTFTQLAPHAMVWRLVGEYKLRFAFTAEVFLAGSHGTVAGSDGHGANLDAVAALLTEIGVYTEGIVHVAVLASPDKTYRPCLPDLGANPHAASA